MPRSGLSIQPPDTTRDYDSPRNDDGHGEIEESQVEEEVSPPTSPSKLATSAAGGKDLSGFLDDLTFDGREPDEALPW